MGTVLGMIWISFPALILLVLAPLYLIYSSLHLPALERRSELDEKTQIYNASYFSKTLAIELNRAIRYDRPLAIIMSDMDLLRHINNTYGHLAGDIVLIGVAAILKEGVREYDTVSRFGGEEFAILLPETTQEKACKIAEQLRHAIERAAFPVTTSDTAISVTMSFGVAGLIRGNETPNQFLHRADTALYESKRQGRNRVCAYEESITPRISEPVQESYPETPIPPVTLTVSLNFNCIFKWKSKARPQPGSLPSRGPLTTRGDRGVPGPQRHALRPGNKQKKILQERRLAVVLFGSALMTTIFSFPGHTDHDFLGLIFGLLGSFVYTYFSVNIFEKQKTVSLAVITLVGGTIYFGAAGAFFTALAAALGIALRDKEKLTRFFFDAGRFTLGNFGVVLILGLQKTPFLELYELQLTMTAISCVMIYYFLSPPGLKPFSRAGNQTNPFLEAGGKRTDWSPRFSS